MVFIGKRDYGCVNFGPEDICLTVVEVPMQCGPSVRENRDVRLADCSQHIDQPWREQRCECSKLLTERMQCNGCYHFVFLITPLIVQQFNSTIEEDRYSVV